MHGRDAYAETIFSVEHLLPSTFHVISLQAPHKSAGEGYEWFKPYDYDHPLESFGEEHYREGVRFAAEAIASLLESKQADKDRLFLLGFSQGAAMCYFLGLERKLKPKGVVPMSGFFPRPIEKWNAINTSATYLVTHGTEDKVVSADESKYGADFLRRHNIEAAYYEYKGRHKMTLPLLKHIGQWLEAKV
jgi:phospholipase/carboxylesterase